MAGKEVQRIQSADHHFFLRVRKKNPFFCQQTHSYDDQMNKKKNNKNKLGARSNTAKTTTTTNYT